MSHSRPAPMPANQYFWHQSTSTNGFVTFPMITNLSHLAVHVEWNIGLKHLSSDDNNDQHYPRVPVGCDKYRLRNLALGGPYQSQLDYRREHLGALHYGRRCQICCETLGELRPYKHAFGVLFCRVCYKKHTLSKFSHLKPELSTQLTFNQHPPRSNRSQVSRS